MNFKYFCLLGLYILPALPASAKSTIHPKVLFTWLAIGSTAVVVALWLMIWSRRKR